ncbi:MAG TPA: pilus assembly protein PilP [Gammaproteobacteria bacterium]|nr:pilus assembly protein PilP [Gammaproteobacteria bacterium]
MTVESRALPKLILLVALAGLLAGCGEGLGDLRAYVQQIRAQPPGRIEPIPEFTPYQNFEYASSDLRDPFKLVDFRRPEELPEDVATLGSGIRPDIDRVKEPLEDFPLDTLRLKGTIDDKDGVKWGLIFAPDNTIHRVIEGNYMGQNHGRIISITDQKIELTEIVPDGLGNYIERSSAVALSE